MAEQPICNRPVEGSTPFFSNYLFAKIAKHILGSFSQGEFMSEKYTASPNMQKFFDKLLKLKDFVKQELKNKKDPVMDEIYKKLDEIIKSTEEKK